MRPIGLLFTFFYNMSKPKIVNKTIYVYINHIEVIFKSNFIFSVVYENVHVERTVPETRPV